MPGKVISLIAQPGSEVEQGAPLLILEAMKMEHTIAAPAKGNAQGLPLRRRRLGRRGRRTGGLRLKNHEPQRHRGRANLEKKFSVSLCLCGERFYVSAAACEDRRGRPARRPAERKQLVPAAVKVELIDRLGMAGLKAIEATAFVSPKWVPQMGDAAEVMASLPRRPASAIRCWCPT
jgi:hypothetical protein